MRVVRNTSPTGRVRVFCSLSFCVVYVDLASRFWGLGFQRRASSHPVSSEQGTYETFEARLFLGNASLLKACMNDSLISLSRASNTERLG